MEKDKFSRVKEAVTILKKLIEFGFDDQSEDYLTTKGYMDEWIKNGKEQYHIIPFYSCRRNGHLTLPLSANKSAEMVLKVMK